MGSYLKNKRSECCSGCQSCANICPKNCISMEYDYEGFLYPEINKSECINCNMCLKVCSYEKQIEIKNQLKEVYAVKNKNKNIIMKSSSGGMFIPISDWIINRGGVVLGAKFNEEFKVIHSAAENKEHRDEFCTSKYIQSDIKDTYKIVKKYLANGRYVLFTGSPCQVDGLIRFLGKKYENLFTVDFICHGVPSTRIFFEHISLLEKKYKSKVKNITFRYKKEGWGSQNLKIDFNNDETYLRFGAKDNFYKLFLSDTILRPSCYNCNFTNIQRVSDITIADFWGIDKIRPNFVDESGVSLVIINSQKGKEIFNSISDELKVEKCTIDEAMYKQPNLKKSCDINKRRNGFFKLNDKYGYRVACLYGVTWAKVMAKIKNI